MKSREQKESIISGLKEQFQGYPGVVLTGYQGLTVAQITKLRNELKPLGGRFTVLKNTLARIAAKGTSFEKIMEKLEGARGAAFVGADAAPTLKALFKLSKEMPKFELLEGLIDGLKLDPAQLKAFSEMPSRDELRSMLVGILQAPMQRMVSVLAAPSRDMVGVLKAYEDDKGKGEAAPATA